MRLYRGLNQIGMILLVLGLAWSAAFAGAAEAGYLESPLNDIIAQSAPDEKISAIIVMADRVDNERLNSSLKARKATFAQRHFEVITRLKQKAVLTQGPVIETLQQLQTQGAIDEYKSFWISNMISFKGTPEAIRQIAALAPVEKIIYDYPIEMIKPKIKEAETPIIATRSQGLDVISAPQVWAMGFTGYGRLVSNIDTGVDGTHPALSSRWRGNNGHPAAECWYDPVEGSTTPIDHGEGDVPHGTHTMGTICGRSTTTPDTVGVAINAQWIACASVDYGGSTSDIIASFQFIADPDDNPSTTDDVPDVVGNSWGYSPFFHSVAHCDNTFWSVMDGCENAGVVVIFSAGNEGDYYGDDTPNSLRTPADRATTYFNAFSVGAIYGYIGGYPIAEFSSRGPCDCASDNRRIKPECVAPGVNIRSCVPGGYESGWDGTSMASPHISGAVAILRQINPELTVDEIKNILIQSCVDLGPVGEDNTYGHGVLDLYQAAQMAIQGIGFIEGYARDLTYSTGLPATIYIPGTELSTVANGSGYYLLTVPGDTTYLVRATYEGYVPDEHSIAVTQGDTATQDFYLVPPIIDYSPASYNVSIPPGQSTARNLKIKNIGVGTIHFALYTETYSLLLNNGIKLPISIDEIKPLPLGYRPADETKAGSIAEPYYPPVIAGQGGPDAFGYRWIDSDDPGGPSVSWVDISSQGTSVSLGEDNSVGPISMGFSFPYYGNNYSSLYIGSNGILTFGGGSGEWINDYIPDTADPDNLIAVWWDDLSPDDGGSVKYYYDSTNHRFIVSFIGVPNYRWPGGTGSLTFQAILYQSGNIEFNYGTMNPGSDDLQSATIGIENQSGSVGLQVVCNASYMHSNMSIRISAVPDWLSALPEFGSVAAGDSVMATVTFDATELAEGTYNGNINLDSNSPINNQVDIPATLNVTTTPVPSIELSVNAIYDTVYAGQSTIYGLFVSNAGNANLTYNTADDRAWISENPTGGTVLPSQSESVAVTFNATSLSPGNYTGTITVTSNDPVHPSINVPCYLFVDLLLTDDVGVSEILQPPDSMLTGTGYPLEVVVRNYGIEYKTFDVIFEAYPTGASTAVFSDTITVTGMAPAGTDTVTFADMFTPPVDTTYSLQAYTNLAGDQVPENNLAAKAGLSYTLIYFWYGNPGINPVTAPIGEPVNIDIFIRTPSTAFIADLHLCLGTDNEYIDSLLSESQGQL
jgi:subtilisin family serine protease